MASLNVKVSVPSYMFDTRCLIKLGRFSVEDLALYLCWSILAENSLFLDECNW